MPKMAWCIMLDDVFELYGDEIYLRDLDELYNENLDYWCDILSENNL
jgi:hypothetical protein